MTKHCQHCNTDFVNQSTLTRHNNTKHADKIPAFIHHEHRCLICGTKFGRKDALRRHNLSTHTLDQKKRCQFCQVNFRRDYFPRHESTCARKYWAKFCRNADLTKGVRDDQSDEISRRQPIRREMSLDAPLFLAKAGDKGLRVVHEIDIDTRLASRAFDFVYVHCGETGDLESLSEAITAGFRHSVPIKPPEGLGVHRINHQFHKLFWLATSVGEYVCGETDINDEDNNRDTLLNCTRCRSRGRLARLR
jgi:DNA-directed RNA polymerase subunit RPC12/RpoP